MSADPPRRTPPRRTRFYRSYRRQKSSIGYRPAKYTVLLMLLLMAAMAPIPYLGKLAWLVPMGHFFLERSSRFLGDVAIHSALVGFLRGSLIAILDLIQSWLRMRAFRSQSDTKVIEMLTDTRWSTAARLIDISFYVVILIALVLAWRYRALRLPGLGALTERIVETRFPDSSDKS